VARPTQKEARRRDLIAAAERAVQQHGVAQVKLKHIAEAAGVSPTSLLYYYDDGLDAILADVHRGGMERFCALRERAVAELDSPVAQLVSMIRLGLPVGADDHLVRMLYEMSAFLQRNRFHAMLASQFIQRQVLLYEQVFRVGQASGDFVLGEEPRVASRSMLALEDGLCLHVIIGSPTFARPQALRAMSEFATLATGTVIDASDP